MEPQIPTNKPTATTVEKLESLAPQLAKATGVKGKLDLTKFDCDLTDLTPDFFLTRFENPHRNCNLLQLLAILGFLPWIHEYLTPDIVLKRVLYSGQFDRVPRPFLHYCAEKGQYLDLPAEYHSRSHLLFPMTEYEDFSTLDIACVDGTLHLLPLDDLRPEDFTVDRLKYVCRNKQSGVVDHLICPQNITSELLSCCFYHNCLPKTFIPLLTVKQLLGDDHGAYPIKAAALAGCLDQLPMALLIPHYHQVQKQIKEFLAEISEDAKEFPDVPLDDCIQQTLVWLSVFSQKYMS